MSRRSASSLKQLTVRGFGEELERRLRALARAEGISLNEAALRLLRKGASLGGPSEPADAVGSALDHLAGTWTDDDVREFEAAVRPMEQIDEAFWRSPPKRAARSRG
jgi:hypothetical protein